MSAKQENNRLSHTPPEGSFGVTTTDRRELLSKPTHSIVYVTDFNDQDAPARCKSRLEGEFAKNGTVNKPSSVFITDVHRGNILHGAFRLREQHRIRKDNNAGPTVYIGVVDPGVGGKRAGIVIETEAGNWFVGPDNGLLTAAANEEGVKAAWKIRDEEFNKESVTFHGLTVFTPIGAALASGKTPDQLEGWFEEYAIAKLKQSKFEENQVVDIDGYGNLVVNTTLPTRPKARSAEVELPTHLLLRNPHILRRGGIPLPRLKIPVVSTFEEVKQRKFLAYPGSNEGRLEVAIRIDPGQGNEGSRKRSAAGRLGVSVGDIFDAEWIFANQEPFEKTVFRKRGNGHE